MIRKNALCAALLAGLSGLSLHAVAAPSSHAPTEMNSAPVVAAPQAGALGGAEFATSAKASAPRVVGLAAPGDGDVAALRASRGQRDKQGAPFQIGVSRDVAHRSVDLAGLSWQPLANGGLGARFEISSAGAVALRAALALKSLQPKLANPAAVTLHFAGNDGRVFEQNGADFAGPEAGWSPVVNGDTLTVEIVLAAGQRPEAFALRVPQLSHLDLSPTATEQEIMAKIGESDPCERDIVCRANPPKDFAATSKAVARMVFTDGGDSYLCTGTLLNNTHVPKKNLFWTAAHCVSTQTVASTLQTYWFYDATACGGNTANPGATTLNGGATLRHADTGRDTSLLELRTAPPSGATYAGWSSSAIGATGTAIEGIHHPAGDVKKYSLGTVTGLSTTIDGIRPLYRVQWNTGVTEGGSSGSGLFTVTSAGAYQLRGGLYGGTSYCTAPKDPDYYSRFADIYQSVKTYFGP